MYQLKYFSFPSDFKFGIADADLQIIGEKHTLKHEHSEPTLWTHFAKTSGKVFDNQTPLEGIDRYNKWKEDLQIIKDLGVKHYRTSVSMFRIMTRDKKPNLKALKWYEQYFSALRKNNIVIYVTLYHWDLPYFLSDQGGWKNRQIVEYLVEHAKIVQKYLGDFIDEYFILNEPYQFTFLSYHAGEHAPGETNLRGALTTVHNALLAQGHVFHELKNINKKLKISTVYNPRVTYAASSSKEDIQAAQYAFGYHTSMFTDPVYIGTYPEYMMNLFEKHMPKISDEDMKIIKIGNGLHSFGVNYYRGMTIRYDPQSDVKFAEVRHPQGISNGLGWPVYTPPTYPEGLYDLLRELYHRYVHFGLKKFYITENGTCWNDTVSEDKTINDEFRIFFIQEHVQQVQKAILAGIPVKGYFLWTLMDNYEWDMGHKKGSDFGIVHVDRKTFARIPKKSFYWYKKLLKNRSLNS